MRILQAFLAATLFVTPGAWLAFGILDPRSTSRRIAWALAAVLSPAALAVQVIALAFVGVPFVRAVPWLAALNLPALVFAFMRSARGVGREQSTPAWLSSAVWLMLLAPIAWWWIATPEYRVFGWHNAMNTAISYRVADLPRVPEDPDLAGVRLDYGWLGHVQPTAVAALADVAPTRVFPFVNALMLWAALAFLEGAASGLSPRHRASATIASAFVLAGTMITGLVLHEWIPANASAWVRELPGDLRVAPILAKFHNFDAMVIGIAGLAAIVYLTVAAWTSRPRRAWLALPIVAAAIGLSYPLLFPFAMVVLAVAWVTAPIAATDGAPSALSGHRGKYAVAALLACAATASYARFLGADAEGSFLSSVHWQTVVYAAITMVHVLGIWIWLAWPSLREAVRIRRGPELALAISLVLLVAVALALQMKGDTQYKVYFAQVMVVVPLTVRRLDAWFTRWPASAAMAVVLVAGLSVMTACWIHRDAPDPPRARTIALDESSFPLTASAPANAWMRAVRERLPESAIVVAPPSDLPLAALTGRAQFLSTHPQTAPVIGYSLEMGFLFENKGYPRASIAERARAVAACYVAREGDVSVDFAELTVELRSLGRPLAIVFPRFGSAYERWLRSNAVGQELYADDHVRVWRLDA